MRFESLSVFIMLVIFWGCKTPTETIPAIGRFPEIFLEAGSDIDTTYISLRTIRLQDGTLKIQATGWGVEEYGLFLNLQTENKFLTMNIMGECGTVFTRTYVKRTFEHVITKSAEDTLERIRFTNFRDTLVVVKIH